MSITCGVVPRKNPASLPTAPNNSVSGHETLRDLNSEVAPVTVRWRTHLCFRKKIRSYWFGLIALLYFSSAVARNHTRGHEINLEGHEMKTEICSVNLLFFFFQITLSLLLSCETSNHFSFKGLNKSFKYSSHIRENKTTIYYLFYFSISIFFQIKSL